MRSLLSRIFGRAPAAPAFPAERPARLIVGLGNPGAKYAETRHNAGFHVLARLRVTLQESAEVRLDDALYSNALVDGALIGLAEPQTYMNRSGEVVSALLDRFGLRTEDLLVVTDDLSLPVGQIRIRPKGGAGGHNGLQDIADELGSTVYPRLRIGVGNTFAPGAQVDYVLSAVPEEERAAYDKAIERAAQAVQVFASEGMTAAMNRFN